MDFHKQVVHLISTESLFSISMWIVQWYQGAPWGPGLGLRGPNLPAPGADRGFGPKPDPEKKKKALKTRNQWLFGIFFDVFFFFLNLLGIFWDWCGLDVVASAPSPRCPSCAETCDGMRRSSGSTYPRRDWPGEAHGLAVPYAWACECL